MNVLLGVSGGIAAYKIPFLVRLLVKSGHHVHCVTTQQAQAFVTQQTLEVLTKNPVYPSPLTQWHNHIDLAKNKDRLIVAPATANIIAKLAYGVADDLLTTTWLMATCPKIIVPAMHTQMWQQPVVQENIERLNVRVCR